MEPSGLRWDAVIRSAVVGLIAALILTAMASAFLSMTASPMGWEPSVGRVVAWLSVATAGFIASRRAGHMGWLHGGLGGVAFFVIALALGSLVFDQPVVFTSSLVRLGLAAVFGAMGGMIALAF